MLKVRADTYMRSEPLDFDREVSRYRLESLSKEQKVAFVLLLAERWYPCYREFSDRAKWGDPDALRDAG